MKALDELAKSPPVLAAFAQSLSAADLLTLYADAEADEAHPLDDRAVVDALMSSSQPASSLMLARFAAGRGFADYGLDRDRILNLATRSAEHLCALLSNWRIDWYSVTVFHRELKDDILSAALLRNDAAAKAMAENPRMDRRLLGEAIRGKGPFDALPLETRFQIGVRALSCKEIRPPRSPDPDSIELDFARPNEAFVYLLRDVLSLPRPRASWWAYTAFRALSATGLRSYGDNFAVHNDDWATTPEVSGSPGSMETWNTRYYLHLASASDELARWVISAGHAEPLDKPEGVDDDAGWDLVGNLVVYLIAKAIRSQVFAAKSLRKGDLPERELKSMRERGEWVCRSASYAAELDLGLESEFSAPSRVRKAITLIEAHRNDAAALIRGLSTSRKFWALWNSSNEVSSAFESLSSAEGTSGPMTSANELRRWTFEDARDEIIERAKPLEERATDDAKEDDGAGLRTLTAELTNLKGALQAGRAQQQWTFYLAAAILIYLVFR